MSRIGSSLRGWRTLGNLSQSHAGASHTANAISAVFRASNPAARTAPSPLALILAAAAATSAVVLPQLAVGAGSENLGPTLGSAEPGAGDRTELDSEIDPAFSINGCTIRLYADQHLTGRLHHAHQ